MVVSNRHKVVLVNYEKSASLLLNCMCYILLDFNSKIISSDPTISVIRLFSVVGCFVLFCRPVCFRWVSLTYNHSVVATVCWNAVTSVKNISSCGPQKSTVIALFLRSTVRYLLRTDRNQKVKPPVSHVPISKETVFRKIHLILAYAETIIKRFSKGVIYIPVLHLRAKLVFCAVLWNRSCR